MRLMTLLKLICIKLICISSVISCSNKSITTQKTQRPYMYISNTLHIKDISLAEPGSNIVIITLHNIDITPFTKDVVRLVIISFVYDLHLQTNVSIPLNLYHDEAILLNYDGKNPVIMFPITEVKIGPGIVQNFLLLHKDKMFTIPYTKIKRDLNFLHNFIITNNQIYAHRGE